MKRNIYEKKTKIGTITQGSIINGCIAEDFPKEEVYGCIITPRCALSHSGKVNTVHYIPIVPFVRWFEVIGKPMIKNQWKNELKNQINQVFKDEISSETIMDVEFSYDDICQIVEKKIGDKKKTKLLELIDKFYEKDPKYFDIYMNERNKMTVNNLKNLKENKLSPYYLIESWNLERKSEYYILMLRDIRRVEITIIDKIKNGVSESELSPIDLSHNDLYISEKQNNFFWVEAQIMSPFIEHILQAFMYNFSRIGVDDMSTDTLNHLLGTIKNNSK